MKSTFLVDNKINEGFWTLPNILSLSRIVIVPIILWGFSQNSVFYISALLVFGFLTDTVDGYLARRFGWESKWGLILDPLADKILICSVVVFLLIFREFPIWAAVIIISRDVFILSAGVYLYFNSIPRITPANQIGKLTTLFMGGALFFYAIELQPFGKWILWIALGCVVSSGIYYAIEFLRELGCSREVFNKNKLKFRKSEK